MPLMRISEYQQLFTPTSRPARKTVISRIRRKELHGDCIGGMWYVDPDIKPEEKPLRDVADAIFKEISVNG